MLVLILQYLFIALFLAYLGNVFSKKRAVKMEIRKYIWESRLSVYASLHKILLENSLIVAPPMLNENYYWSLIDGMPFHIGDQKMEFVSCFGSYDLLVEYTYRLRQEGKVKSSYLPEDMIACLDLALEWYEGIMNLLTAFKMTEQADMSMDEKIKVRHLNLACNLFGIALQKDIAVVTNLLIEMVTDSLHTPSLMNLFKVSVVNQWKIRRFKKNFYGLAMYLNTPSICAYCCSIFMCLRNMIGICMRICKSSVSKSCVIFMIYL